MRVSECLVASITNRRHGEFDRRTAFIARMAESWEPDTMDFQYEKIVRNAFGACIVFFG